MSLRRLLRLVVGVVFFAVSATVLAQNKPQQEAKLTKPQLCGAPFIM